VRLVIAGLAVAGVVLAQQDPGEKLVSENDCSGCHAVDQPSVGPSYAAIAKRYAGQAGAAAKLAARVREGGSGTWGDVAMTAHPDLKDSQLKPMLAWILSVKSGPAAAAPKTDAKLYSYKLKNGATRELDFPVYAEGKAPKVTKDIFKGYALYNSYCYRCHGTDATGGELAPDLRKSVSSGMQQQGFLSVAMAGKEAKGMPSWAGFITREDMVKVYRYVKGRSLDLVPTGRPPSEQD
jgi:cytochrome c